MKTYRQGDLLFIEDKLPENTEQVAREDGKLILARGEATGHAHTIRTPGVELHLLDGRRWVVAPDGGTTVTHEEHVPLSLPLGVWRVAQQREYTPAGIRPVMD